MSSQKDIEDSPAALRFLQAFERLKEDTPKFVAKGTPVTQNNVAREANCDASALKLSRFPKLIGKIQAYVELHKPEEQPEARKAALRRAANRSLSEQLADAKRQRDHAQSILSSAEMRIMDLTREVKSLRQQLDEVKPPPVRLGPR